MKAKRIFRQYGLCVLACVALFGLVNRTETRAAMLGDINADDILFLGNSITLHGPYPGWSDTAHWGMAASEESKDYVHVLTSSINAATGGSIELAITDSYLNRWYYGYPMPNYVGNILNIGDIFERNFDTWENARIQNQLNAQPDIVVLQFGENLDGGSDQQLATALDTMLTGLKNAGDPHIFITSSILGADPARDVIKQQACAADPSRRFFVDLNDIVNNSGAAGHPSDAGMQTIANTIFNAMVGGAPPPPRTLNVDINGRSTTSQSYVTYTGAAVVGAAGDIWNGYTVDAANPAGGTYLSIDPPQSDFLVDSAGNATTVKFDIAAVCGDAPTFTDNAMANDLAFVEGLEAGTGFPTSTTLTLSGLEAGATYDLYLYAPARFMPYAATFTVGDRTGSTRMGNVFTGTWRHGLDYVRFPGVTVAGDGTIQCEFVSANPENYGMVSGLQLVEAEPAAALGGTPVNIDINGRSVTSQTNVTKSGAAAIGEAGDIWNAYVVDAANPAGGVLPSVDPAQSGFLLDADGNATTIKFDVASVCADAPNFSIDDMANDNIFVEGLSAGTGFPTSTTFTISGLDVGEAYDLYLYSPAAFTPYAAKFTIDGEVAATPIGTLFTGVWNEGMDYVVFSDVIAVGGVIECLMESANPDNYGMLSGLQIVLSLPAFTPGDANGDGVVDDEDASILGAHWRQIGGVGWAEGDFNRDGNVNDADAAILAAHWGEGVGEESVPEPGSLALLVGVAVMGMVYLRRWNA
jgi:hypothetical protein